MLRRPNQRFIKNCEQLAANVALSHLKGSIGLFSTSSGASSEHFELPGRRRKSERKPLVTSINELKRAARLQRKLRCDVREIILKPPENGLLVKNLIPVARKVYDARIELYDCASLVMKSVHVHVCRSCKEACVGEFPHQIRSCYGAGSLPKEHCWVPGEIEHILPVIDSFHLYDRLGRAVSHDEILQVDRIPAIVELCVQAGLDMPEYPTKRRVYPVYSIAGKLIDFERKYPRDFSSGKDIEPHGFWLRKKDHNKDGITPSFSHDDDLQGTAIRGLNAWEKMRSGAIQMMQKYAVQTCGYCPEVQVGPKGNRARICQAHKHQMRAGQHAWQTATIDDLVPPVYVWHVPEPGDGGGILVHELRRYYGKLPAVVELFAQAGARVGSEYDGLMRQDVALPGLDEEKLVV